MHDLDDVPAVRRVAPAPAVGGRVWHAVVAMLALAVVVYLPAALRAGFLDFDDDFFFGAQNDVFRDGLGAVLDPSRPIANAWLPVAHVSLWFDWAIAGVHPFLAHAHAMLLHGLAGALLVRLALALGATRGVALLAGALFVVHPALAESVAWVSGRKDLLSGLLTFAAMLAVVHHCRRPRAAMLLGIALLTALAMYAKATAVVLPLLAALACALVGGPPRRFVAALVSFVVAVPIAWHHQAIAADEGTLAAGSAVARSAQVPGALMHYLGTTVWPCHLNVLYPEVDTLRHFRTQLVSGTVATVVLLALAVVGWRRPRSRLAAFGVAAFLVALLPFNTAYPGSSIAAADRYLYLAIPGAAIAVAETLRAVGGRWGIALGAGITALSMFVCGGRAHDFGDDETLWRSSLAQEPRNAVAHLNLVYELLGRGPADVKVVRDHLEAAVAAAAYPVHELRARQLLLRVAMTEADYTAAAAQARAAVAAARAQLARESSDKRRNEAMTLLLQALLAAFEPLRLAGDADGAAATWADATAMLPDHPDVVAFGVARDLVALGDELRANAAKGSPWLRDDDARGAAADAVLEAALQLHPRHAGLLCARANWERARDRVLPALRDFRLAQQADPGCVDAWLGAARLLRERENFAEAAEYARKGLAVRPDPALRQEYALALVGQGRLDDAVLQLEAYMKVRPADRDTAKVLANVLVGRAYGKLGEADSDPAEVLRTIERALAYNPDEGKAHLVLGRLLREQRQVNAALGHLEKAFALLPDFDDARRSYAECLADAGYDRVLRRDDEGASEVWLRCLAVAPPDLDTAGIRTQLAALWRRYEAKGVERAQQGDRDGAIAAFRKCLAIDPQQHWAAWLLASVLQKDPDTDLDELERLCRQAVAWQQQHGLCRADQVLLLATTLVRRGRGDEAKAAVQRYLDTPDEDAKPQVLAALRRLAAD